MDGSMTMTENEKYAVGGWKLTPHAITRAVDRCIDPDEITLLLTAPEQTEPMPDRHRNALVLKRGGIFASVDSTTREVFTFGIVGADRESERDAAIAREPSILQHTTETPPPIRDAPPTKDERVPKPRRRREIPPDLMKQIHPTLRAGLARMVADDDIDPSRIRVDGGRVTIDPDPGIVTGGP